MRPVIQKLLLEGLEEGDSEAAGTEKLVKYLDQSLIKLKNKLKPGTFDKVFAILWENASVALRHLMTTNIEVKKYLSCHTKWFAKWRRYFYKYVFLNQFI